MSSFWDEQQSGNELEDLFEGGDTNGVEDSSDIEAEASDTPNETKQGN